MIPIRKDSIIFILAPFNSASGGPEALHQLCYYLTQLDYPAKIAYYFYPDKTQNPTAEKYRQYGVSWCYLDEIQDEEKHLLICPEQTTFLLNGFSRIRKTVWWLSVDFYRANSGHHLLVKIIRHIAGFQFKKALQAAKLRNSLVSFSDRSIIHLTASQYAFNFVIQRGAENVSLLIEPLGLDFLKNVVYRNFQADTEVIREDVVLYNPAKKSRTMQRLMKKYPQWRYFPLQGLSADELIERMKNSKVYVDFGHFPGPERLPKEAVVCGCCIITGRRGAARFYEDVRIPDEFKCADNDLKSINRQITLLMSDYQNQFWKFDAYRKMVSGLEDNLKKQIEKLFVRAPCY